MSNALGGALVNSGSPAVNVAVTEGGSFHLYAADTSSPLFAGASFTLTAQFADGSSATTSVVIP